MTIIDTTDTEPEQHAGHRLATGLRELAAHVETHPKLAEKIDGDRFLVYARDADEFHELSGDLGGQRDKGASDDYYKLTRTFTGGVQVQVYTPREQVCTAKVVGTETVEVPDPNAPTITIERDVVEWECNPVTKLTATEGDMVVAFRDARKDAAAEREVDACVTEEDET